MSERGREAVERIRGLAQDATSAELLARRALPVLDRAVPFDEGAVFGLDGESLLFDRLLAYQGPQRQGYVSWLRNVYLVAGEIGALHVPTLLRSGGVVAMHEKADRWLRSPPPASGPVLAHAWREWESPPGGVVRYGLAVRGRWVGLIQLARLEAGDGFRPAELELLDRAAPALARGLAERLPEGPPTTAVPPQGHLVFDDQRRLVTLTGSAQQWLDLLPNDLSDGFVATLSGPARPTVPVGVQSVVSHLAGSGAATARATIRSLRGGRVTVTGERALRLSSSGEPRAGYSITLTAAPRLGPAGPELTPTQWRVVEEVAVGRSDREIAEMLQVSVHTVHERVAALHEICGTRTRPQLVAALATTRSH
jgi:DNA-binding CsgD family transcriptional regulator